MSQTCSHSENIGERIRLPAGERGFAHALAVSAAVHAALLALLLTAASVQVPGVAAPLGEGLIMAFLVPGNQAAAGKAAVPEGRKSRELKGVAPAASPARNAPVQEAPVRAAAVSVEPAEDRDRNQPGRNRAVQHGAAPAAVPPREVLLQAAPEGTVPAENRDRKQPAESRTPAAGQGSGKEAGPVTVDAFQSSVLAVPGGAGPPAGKGEGGGAARRGDGALPGDAGTLAGGAGMLNAGAGAGTPAARREGAGVALQAGGSPRRPGEVHTFPRYGDNARPAYPPLARLRGYQGVVVLSVEVLADGRAGRVEIKDSAGHDILDRAALEAVRSWRFEPGRKEGRAVTMSVDVPVRFVLNEGAVR